MSGLLTERDRDVLLCVPHDSFVRPMDIGGSNGSHHSPTLQKLARLGLIEQRRRNTLANAFGSSRGSWEYRRIALVDRLIEYAREYSHIGCAGIDQEPDATTLCGKCGPCQAGQFLRLNGIDQPR